MRICKKSVACLCDRQEGEREGRAARLREVLRRARNSRL